MSARKRKRSAEGTSARARHVGVLARDTIVAVSTAPGRGAIAVVRLSGTAAERICRRVVSPGRGWPLVPRQATRCAIHACDDRHTPIDDGLVTVFPAPGSYTGETVVELHVGDRSRLDEARRLAARAITISDSRPEARPLILEEVRS